MSAGVGRTASPVFPLNEIMDQPPEPLNAVTSDLVREFPQLPATLLARYLADIVTWNDRVGLVSRRSTTAVLDRLVRQSVLMYQFLSENRPGAITSPAGEDLRVVDVGSGAGFPGVVWNLLQPALRVTMIERKQKKATFLQRTVKALALERADAIAGDALELARRDDLAGSFNVAASFAVGTPDSVARLIEPFLDSSGVYCTMRPRGEEPLPEIANRALSVVSYSDNQFGRFCLYARTPTPDSE